MRLAAESCSLIWLPCLNIYFYFLHVLQEGSKVRVVTEVDNRESQDMNCYSCKCLVTGWKAFKSHSQQKAHKEKLDKLIMKGIKDGEKLCSLCKMLCKDDGEYQEHLKSILHQSNLDDMEGREVVLFYRCVWCKKDFGSNLKEFKWHNLSNKKKHERLMEEAEIRSRIYKGAGKSSQPVKSSPSVQVVTSVDDDVQVLPSPGDDVQILPTPSDNVKTSSGESRASRKRVIDNNGTKQGATFSFPLSADPTKWHEVQDEVSQVIMISY